MALDENDIQDFLQKSNLAILSTVNQKGQPDAAPIYYVMDEDFNFYFLSSMHSQKNSNLQHQNEIVLTITDEMTQQTVQVKGKAAEAKDQIADIVEKLAQKLNRKDTFTISLPVLMHDDEKTAVKITPYSVRMRRYNQGALEEKELRF